MSLSRKIVFSCLLLLATWLVVEGIAFVALGIVGGGLARAQRGRGAVLLAGGAAGFLAAGSAMLRIPPPQFFVPTSISQIFFGFDLKVPPGFGSLAGQWRPNLLFVTASVVAVAAYLLGVRRLARQGERWPAARTIAWTIGWGRGSRC